ncbi:MAG: DUF296 domain-containing protein [Proteobacteria bacterium]|nr:DUF296 domain-containing protein [Pseudomonadota bacterium]
MEYRTGEIRRVFWARFNDGENLRAGLEDLARRENVEQGLVMVLGALGEARLVVGPKEKTLPPEPVWTGFQDGREILGLGTMIRGPEGPDLHLHLAAGRSGRETLAGCLREDGLVYLVVEAVMFEVTGLSVRRTPDKASGLNLPGFF